MSGLFNNNEIEGVRAQREIAQHGLNFILGVIPCLAPPNPTEAEQALIARHRQAQSPSDTGRGGWSGSELNAIRTPLLGYSNVTLPLISTRGRDRLKEIASMWLFKKKSSGQNLCSVDLLTNEERQYVIAVIGRCVTQIEENLRSFNEPDSPHKHARKKLSELKFLLTLTTALSVTLAVTTHEDMISNDFLRITLAISVVCAAAATLSWAYGYFKEGMKKRCAEIDENVACLDAYNRTLGYFRAHFAELPHPQEPVENNSQINIG